MPIPVEMMRAAARSGLSIVCAACERYWEARENGMPGDQCTAQSACGSPLAGDCFREYRGIMTVEAFRKFCFVCGEAATYHLSHPTWPREIGICRDHVGWMKDDAMRRPQRGGRVTSRNGFELPPENTLLGAILRTEMEWAEQDGREFDPKAFLKGEEESDVPDR